MEAIPFKQKLLKRKDKMSIKTIKKPNKRTPHQMEALRQAEANPVQDQIQNQIINNRIKNLKTPEFSQNRMKANGNKIKDFPHRLSIKRKKNKANL